VTGLAVLASTEQVVESGTGAPVESGAAHSVLAWWTPKVIVRARRADDPSVEVAVDVTSLVPGR